MVYFFKKIYILCNYILYNFYKANIFYLPYKIIKIIIYINNHPQYWVIPKNNVDRKTYTRTDYTHSVVQLMNIWHSFC